jgi:hypothetical protein
MEKTKNRAAPYSTTDEKEILAVDTFKTLVDHEKVKLDIKERDKYPNIDGYIELVDELLTPLGKLEVQIRKLPDNQQRIQCPLSLFAFSKRTCNPVLLIGVDITQKKAYWVHVSNNLLDKAVNENEQKTKVVSFSDGNVLDGKDTKYIVEWKNIVDTYQAKIQGYDKLREIYDELSKRANPALGIEKDDFVNMHVFLDRINSLLDGDFLLVKRRFYPMSWKIGLAYNRYEDNALSYVLYPMPNNMNDVQIKTIDEPIHKQLWEAGLEFVGYNVENPIKQRPKGHAIEVVESKTLRILKNRLLDHGGNEFLAREFIFAFIDRFSEQLGLDKKDKYFLDDIYNAFLEHLPIWVEEASKFMVKVQRNGVKSLADLLYGRLYFDPEMLIHQIMPEERKQIEQKVKERVQKGGYRPIPLSNDRFPFRILSESLSFLKSAGFKEIDRPYSQKDFTRLEGKSGWVWNVFSSDVIETNLNIFFNNLPKAYDYLASKNFPEIAEKLRLFSNASLVIIIFSVKDNYVVHEDAPVIKFFYLKTEDQGNLEIKVYREGQSKELPELSHEYLGKEIEIGGKKCELIGMSTGILDFIYDDLPMFNFVYDVLEENLVEYFRQRKKDFS